MERKFKVGDRVKIRQDLVAGTLYDDLCFVGDMVEFLGKETTVSHIDTIGYYSLDECSDWSWNDAMLEDIEIDNNSLLKEASKRYSIGTKFKSPNDDFEAREVDIYSDEEVIDYYFDSDGKYKCIRSAMKCEGGLCSNPLVWREDLGWAEIVGEEKENVIISSRELRSLASLLEKYEHHTSKLKEVEVELENKIKELGINLTY